jgi:hypothetical protein
MTWWVTKEPPYVIKAMVEVPEKEDGSGKGGGDHHLHDGVTLAPPFRQRKTKDRALKMFT